MKVRWKVVATLVVPLGALIGLAAIGVVDRRDTEADAARSAELIAAADRTAVLVESVALESVHSAAAGVGVTSGLSDARAATDASSHAFLDAPPSGSADLADAVTKASRTIDGLGVVRGAVDQGGDGAANALTVYSLGLDRLTSVLDALPAVAPDAGTAAALRAQASIAKAASAWSSGAALAIRATGTTLDDEERGRIAASFATAATQIQVHDGLTDAEGRQALRQATAGQSVDLLASVRDAVAAGTDPAPAQAAALDAADATVRALATVRLSEAERVASAAIATRDSAERDVRAYALLAAAALLAALISASIVGRSITRPLRRLVDAANEVADQQLPAMVSSLRAADPTPMPVPGPVLEHPSSDEIGTLAEAFDAIRRTAIEVAAEQGDLLRKGIGDLFVNLARRNQSLLDRQIGFLDELEAKETDPDTLEHLFRLDHLATRMRRNAESLLVLAGVDTPRRWGRPVPVGDVVRAAIGEVEDYSRISTGALGGSAVVGAAAADVAHLLSELLDNATQYSPPGTIVEVSTAPAADGLVVCIDDPGIGMGPEQLDDANAVLTTPPATGLSLSRSLGLTVVAKLAHRHRVFVRLGPSPLGGVRAEVLLPQSLLADLTEELGEPVEAVGPLPATSSAAAAIAAPAPMGPEPLAPLAPLSSLASLDAPEATVDPPASRPAGVPVSVWEQLAGPSASSAWVERAWAAERSDTSTVRPRHDSVVRAARDEALGATEPEPVAPPQPFSFAPQRDASVTSAPEPLVPQAAEPLSAPMPEPPVAERPVLAEPPIPAIAANLAAQPAPVSLAEALPSVPDVPPPMTDAGLPRRRGADVELPAPAAGVTVDPAPLAVLPPPVADLPRRSRGAMPPPLPAPVADGATASQRSPEEIRRLLSSYRTGLDRGRRTPPPPAPKES